MKAIPISKIMPGHDLHHAVAGPDSLPFDTNSSVMKRLAFILLAFARPVMGMAHPGAAGHTHGSDTGWTITHYLLTVDHIVPVILALVIISGLAGIVHYVRQAEKAS